MAEIYHRSLAGWVTWIEMTRDEVEKAVKCAPWEWAADPKRRRGEPVYPTSLADPAKPS